MYLGIDLGTSGIKLLLLNNSGRSVATADAPLQVSRPQALWSEQNPADWWSALDSAMAQLRSTEPAAMAAVRAIGLSGQMHGAVVLGGQQQVLRPAILWNDGRCAPQCAELEQREPRSRQITGNLAMPGFTAPKLLWIKEHENHIWQRLKSILLPKDWLRLQLSGEMVSDMSDASGTLWLDVAARNWSLAMLAATGLGIEHMPRLVEGSAASGWLKPELVQRWGLPAKVLIAGGGGDNAASAVGIGAVRPGQGFVSLGTSGVIFLVSASFQPAPEEAVHAFCHALPGRWHQMSVMLSAASALSWLVGITGSANEAALLNQVASLSVQQRAVAPLFLPYLSGERTPHNNPLASASFSGLRQEHGPADMAYAVIEGVGFGLKDGLQAMRQGHSGEQALSLVGGGARSDLWGGLLAAILGCPLVRHDGAQAAAALGAARLAWLADGGDEATVCQEPQGGTPFEPDAAQAAMLAPRYARYRALYAPLNH